MKINTTKLLLSPLLCAVSMSAQATFIGDTVTCDVCSPGSAVISGTFSDVYNSEFTFAFNSGVFRFDFFQDSIGPALAIAWTASAPQSATTINQSFTFGSLDWDGTGSLGNVAVLGGGTLPITLLSFTPGGTELTVTLNGTLPALVSADNQISIQASTLDITPYTGPVLPPPPPTPTVPAPATLMLMGLGLAGVGFSRRRKSNC